MRGQAVVHRRVAGDVWSRLHAQYAQAEAQGATLAPVKDSLDAESGASSVAEAYAQAVLLQAAMLGQMSATQIDFAEALLRGWGRKLLVAATPPAAARARPLLVDLAQAARAGHAAGESPAPRLRFIETGLL